MTASRSDALVLFGVTGDLAHKMIFPALYAMAKRGTLKVPVIGVASPTWSLARLHNRVKDSIKRSGGIDNQRALRHLLSLLGYVSGDYNERGTFTKIKETLGHARRPAHYLAIPPSLFPTVITGLGAADLADHAASSSKSRSDVTWPLRENSTASQGRCSRKTRSSASITSSARRRS